MKKLFKITILITLAMVIAIGAAGCARQSDIVSHNLSEEADNFNIRRTLTVINSMTAETLYQVEGLISIEVDNLDSQLEVIAETQPGIYTKDFFGLNELTTYTVVQADPHPTDRYNYTVNYNPKMWIPIKVKTID